MFLFISKSIFTIIKNTNLVSVGINHNNIGKLRLDFTDLVLDTNLEDEFFRQSETPAMELLNGG